MKNCTILFAVILFLPSIAQGEWVNVFGSGDSRVIYRFHDNGEVTTSIANRTLSGWMIVDDQGNMTTVNDYSRDRFEAPGYLDRPSHGCGTLEASDPLVPFD